MFNEKDLRVHQLRQRELVREAERERLLKVVRSQPRFQSGAWRLLSRLAALFL